MDKYQVKILDKKEEYKNVFTYTLEKPNDLSWDEGSSFHLALPGYDKDEEINKKLVHHLSINTLDDENSISFTTKIPIRKSPFKKTLSKLTVGDNVTIFKLGSHMGLRREDRPIVLLSQGLAMSTIRPLIKKFEKDSAGIPELVSINVNNNDTHLYESDFEDVDGSLFIRYWLNSRNEYLSKIKEIAQIKDNAYFYVVGSESFVFDSIYTLREADIADDSIIIDKGEEKRKIVFDALENYKIII